MLRRLFIVQNHFHSNGNTVSTRGGNREPVPTQNRFQLSNSIGFVRLQRYRFFLTIPHHVFRFTQKFCDNPAQNFKQQGSIVASRKQSQVWLHFTKRNDNSAVCNQCNAIISCKGTNTSNMLKHLSTKHGIKSQECHVF